MQSSKIDQQHMRDAADLGDSVRRRTPPNPWVGCVIVLDGQIVGRGATEPPGGRHAEIVALDEAGTLARNSVVYSTLEPCCHTGRTGPCTEALIHAGVQRVVIGVLDPDPKVAGQGCKQLEAAGIEVTLLNDSYVRSSLAPYLKQRSSGRPWVILKSAASIDGRTAAADGSSQWITGSEARCDVHALRDASQAILVGSGTALADRPSLNVRHVEAQAVQPPLRILLDRRGRTPASGPLFDRSLGPLLIVTSNDGLRSDWLSSGAEILQNLSLGELLNELGRRGILQVLVEGGAELHSALAAEELVDQYSIYIGPRFLGASGHPLLPQLHCDSIEHAPILTLQHTEILGDSVRLDYLPCPKEDPSLCLQDS